MEDKCCFSKVCYVDFALITYWEDGYCYQFCFIDEETEAEQCNEIHTANCS